MDGFDTFSAWGLLWIIAGVVVWKFLTSRTPKAEPLGGEDVEAAPASTPEPPIEFPGQPIIAHAVETLEKTFDALAEDQPAEERPDFFIFLAALVDEAYRKTFPDDLAYGTENYDPFVDAFFGEASLSYERRFGPWTPIDEDDPKDFFEAVDVQGFDLDGVWDDRHRELTGGEAEAVNLIAARIETLRR